MTTLRDDLTEAVLGRDKPGWRRREISWDELDRLVGQAARWPQVFVGATHVTIPAKKTRFLVYGEGEVSRGELAREYVRQVYQASPWAGPPTRKISASHPYWAKTPPLCARPVRHRSLAYLDLVHAYWEIIRHYRADVTLTRRDNRILDGWADWLRPEEVDADRPLRHAVAGVLFSRELVWLHYGEEVRVSMPSPYANPSLARLVFDTLHAVAAEIDRTFTLYAWLTDACIVPRRQASAVQDHLRTRWGLASTVKGEGMGDVWSVTTHEVGNKVTRDLRNQHHHGETAPFEGLRRVNVQRYRRWRREALELRPLDPGP